MTLVFNADSDTDSDTEDPSLLFVQCTGIDGSAERQSLSGSHGQRPWL
jgi:hypothetical protein